MEKIVADFISTTPNDHRPVLTKFAEWIEKTIPYDEVIISNGFPVYLKDNQWIAGCSSRKKGPMFYLMKQEILDKYDKQLGKLRSGKSCVEYKATKTISLSQLDSLFQKILQETAEYL